MKEGVAAKGIAPPCSKCGSTDTIWNGAFRVLCKSCGRQPRVGSLSREMPDYTKRPRCPRCGDYRANKHGSEWMCGTCGVCWPKEVLSENNQS